MAATRKKTTARRRAKKTTRKYSPAASEYVRKEMEEMKAGKLRSGRSGKKVTDRKQAIAIGAFRGAPRRQESPQSEEEVELDQSS